MIIEAAIRLKDGRIFTGMRHGHILRNLVLAGLKKDVFICADQGFVDESFTFYSRKDAEDHARSCGQLSGKIIGGVLTSEDLW